MCPGLSDDLQQIDNARKTAIIDRELKRLNIDIAALQETRLSESGSLKESNYTFFWRGQEHHERRLYGVGFAVQNTLLSTIEAPSSGTPRVLSLRLTTSSGPTNILSVYAPLSSATEAKDQFYEELEAKIRLVPKKEHLFLLGDFNARVGAEPQSGLAASAILASASSTKMASASLSCAPSMTFVSPTPSSPPSPTTGCPGDTQGLITGTNWTLSPPEDPC
ncbi:craniofacial development protein 2-like [Penaeus indicus]|uniref:craniofacial development protein 2-like n=1 Tax=Penaeus indicus TaxID=29960 RepID=UPI00300D7CE3